jgi:hypothetical protein
MGRFFDIETRGMRRAEEEYGAKLLKSKPLKIIIYIFMAF